MTIEDLPDLPLEGNHLVGRYPFLFQGSETPVIFSISAAPMPSDCGMLSSCVCGLWSGDLTLSCTLFVFITFSETICYGFFFFFTKLLKNFPFSKIQLLITISAS
jgi:hypothetical protein